MAKDSSYKRLAIQARKKLRVWIDGDSVEAIEGDSAAAVMLAHGETPSRTTAISGTSRAPYCMMGVCFECLMEIDGIENTQGCMTPVREGMRINRQHGAKTLKAVATAQEISPSYGSSSLNTPSMNNNPALNNLASKNNVVSNGTGSEKVAAEPDRTTVEDIS